MNALPRTDANSPALWLDAVDLYLSFGATRAGVAMLERVRVSHAGARELPAAVLALAAARRRLGDCDAAEQLLLPLLREDSPPPSPFIASDIAVQLALTYARAARVCVSCVGAPFGICISCVGAPFHTYKPLCVT